MTHENILRKHFTEGLELPELAVNWLCDFWAVIQLFDDVADKDKIEREDLDRVIWASLIGMNMNVFWLKNSFELSPIIKALILKWQASDQAERAGRVSEQTYMWRAGYYDLVLMVYYLIHGEQMAKNKSELVLSLYGETYTEYALEFKDA